MQELFNEFVNEDEEYEEKTQKKPIENPRKENQNNEVIIPQNEKKKQIGETKKEQKQPKVYEEIRGNHNDFMEKDNFDFKKFVASTDVAVKEKQKTKVFI